MSCSWIINTQLYWSKCCCRSADATLSCIISGSILSYFAVPDPSSRCRCWNSTPWWPSSGFSIQNLGVFFVSGAFLGLCLSPGCEEICCKRRNHHMTALPIVSRGFRLHTGTSVPPQSVKNVSKYLPCNPILYLITFLLSFILFLHICSLISRWYCVRDMYSFTLYCYSYFKLFLNTF